MNEHRYSCTNTALSDGKKNIPTIVDCLRKVGSSLGRGESYASHSLIQLSHTQYQLGLSLNSPVRSILRLYCSLTLLPHREPAWRVPSNRTNPTDPTETWKGIFSFCSTPHTLPSPHLKLSMGRKVSPWGPLFSTLEFEIRPNPGYTKAIPESSQDWGPILGRRVKRATTNRVSGWRL